MRSFGLYYQKEESNTCQLEFCPILKQKVKSLINSEDKHLTPGNDVAEVHCNLWKIPEKKSLTNSMLKDEKYKYFLDFGLMFHPSIKEVVFHLPFEFNEQNLSDLGEKLNDQELCSLIFNDNAQTTSSSRNFHLIKFSNKNLLVYPISSQNLIFKSTKENAGNSKEYIGTNIFISIKTNPESVLKDLASEHLNNVKIYIRFRLHLTDTELKNICKKEFISTDIIQSIFSKNEMFDFRINDDREINRKLDEELRSKSYRPFRMNKVHFLFMADTRNPVVKASKNFKTRFLETEKWGDYVGMPIPECMLAYHWKDKKEKTLELNNNLFLPNENEDSGLFQLLFIQIPCRRINYLAYDKHSSFSAFKLFFMLTYPHRNWKQVFFYGFIAIFLGWIGSVLSSLIFTPCSRWVILLLIIITIIISGCIIWCSWRSLKKDSRVKFHE